MTRALLLALLGFLAAPAAHAAVAAAGLTSGASNANASSYATASITPTGSVLVLAAVVSADTPGPPVQPTLSGNGLTWVLVDTRTYDGGGLKRLSVFRAMGASPSTGAVTIDFGGDGQLGAAWSIAEFSGVDTSGTNGSGAIVQSNDNNADAVTSLTVTLAAFGSVNNATYGAFGSTAATALSVGSGFTQIHETGDTDPRRILSEWRVDNDTSVDASGPSSNWGGIGIEIKAAAAVAGASSRRLLRKAGI